MLRFIFYGVCLTIYVQVALLDSFSMAGSCSYETRVCEISRAALDEVGSCSIKLQQMQVWIKYLSVLIFYVLF